MTRSTSYHHALFALAIFCLACIVGVASSEDNKVIRMAYRFAFEDDKDLAGGRQPTQDEVQAMLCQSNVFFSKSLQEKLKNPAIVAIAKEVDYSFENFVHHPDGGGVPIVMPSSVNFTLNVSTLDGSTVPPMTKILDTFPTLDYNGYLTKYVWKAAPVTKNFFFHTHGLVWQAAIVDPVTGSIKEVKCPEGAIPKALATSAADAAKAKKVSVNETATAASNGISLKLGFWDDGDREPTDLEWEALICEIDKYLNVQLKQTLHDDSIVSYASKIHWEYLTAEYLPAQVNFTLEAFFGNETAVPNEEIFKVATLSDVATADFIGDYVTKSFPEGFNVFAQVDKLTFRGASIRESDPSTTLARATCPVTMTTSEMASFEIKFAFDDEKEREPTRDEIEAVLCEANKFFQKTLREGLKDPSIVGHATNIDWTYNPADEFSTIITFTLLALYGDGSHVRGSDVFGVMETADVQLLTEKYILYAVPLQQNQFYFAKNLFFTGSLGKEITTSKIPNGVTCKKQDHNSMAHFSIQIGFDTRTGVPTEQDIKGLMCQTNLFFEKRLREELKDPGINSHAVNIDWSYIPGVERPALVNFTSFSTYGNGELVPGKVVYDVMAVIDVNDFVTNYIWNSEPFETNIYYDTRYIVFGGEINAPDQPGKLESVVCVPPGLANGSSNVTQSSGPSTGETAATKRIATSDLRGAHLDPHK